MIRILVPLYQALVVAPQNTVRTKSGQDQPSLSDLHKLQGGGGRKRACGAQNEENFFS